MAIVCAIHFCTNLTALMYSEELILNIITVGLESGHYFIQIWSKCFLDREVELIILYFLTFPFSVTKEQHNIEVATLKENLETAYKRIEHLTGVCVFSFCFLISEVFPYILLSSKSCTNHIQLDRGYPNGTNTPRGDNFSRYQISKSKKKV